MLHVVLYQPEIPPNTGNVMRLAANLGARLHLVRPLGFELDEKRVRRAGLDYRELVRVETWNSFAEWRAAVAPPRWFAISARGEMRYDRVAFADGDALVFGPETRGLPRALLEECPAEQRLHIPMQPGNRSLNLSNAVAVIAFEAWRQQGFAGAAARAVR